MEELQRKLDQRYESTKPRKVSYLQQHFTQTWPQQRKHIFWSTMHLFCFRQGLCHMTASMLRLKVRLAEATVLIEALILQNILSQCFLTAV